MRLQALFILLLWPVNAVAQNAEWHSDRCSNGRPLYQLASCTWMLESGSVPGASLDQVGWTIFLNRGGAYQSLGRLDEALLDFDEAIALNPRNPLLYHVRATLHYEMSNLEFAINDLDEAIRLNPSDPSLFSNRAIVHADSGDLSKAIRDYNEAVRLDPTNPTFYRNRGTTYLRFGRFGAAVNDFNEVLRLDSTDVDSLNNRGMAFLNLREFHAAKSDFETAISLSDQPGELQINLALTLIVSPDLRDPQRAIEILNGVSVDSHDPNRRAILAIAYALAGRELDTVREFEALMRLVPDSARNLQQWLMNEGFFEGPVDGQFNDETRESLQVCLRTGCEVGDLLLDMLIR